MDWVILIGVILVIFIGIIRQKEINKMNNAKRTYRQRLREYANNNRSEEFRKAAILAGAEYIKASKSDPRKRKNFTKEKLRNDISNVLGSKATDDFLLHAAGFQPNEPDVSNAPKAAENTEIPIKQRLQKLHALHKDGLIDEDEYAAKKAEILDQI